MEKIKNLVLSLIHNTIKISGNKKSLSFLGIISSAESIFFPIPPDVFLIPIVLAKKYSWKFLALFTTTCSILGGIFGYFIGVFFWDIIGLYIVELYGGLDKINYLKNLFFNYGWMIILIAGFTPLPYKIFTLGSGFLNFNFFLFVFCSIISRGLRFYFLAYLVNKYGSRSIKMVERYFTQITFVVALIFILILILIYRY